MSDIKLDLDISSLSEALENFKKEVTKKIRKGVEGLAKSTHAHIVEEAQNKLHSYREKYLGDLEAPEQLDDTLWVITLKEDSSWIEEGRTEPYDMKPGLLKEGKTSEDGHKYRVVPMNQAKTPSQISPNTKGYEQNMINLVKSELKKKGIPYKKLELDQHTGSPKIGKLHSMNIESYTPGKGNTPQLYGLNIYQNKQKDGSVKRQITTFRTVTDSPEQQDKWIHPPVEARDFFGQAKIWAEQEWEKTWLPQILERYGK